MADKKKVDIYSQFRQQYTTRLPDAQNRAKEIADAYAKDGTPLTDEEVEELTFQLAYGNGKDFSIEREPAEPVAPEQPVIPQPAAPAQEPTGFLGRTAQNIGGVVDALQAGGYRDAAAILERIGYSDNSLVQMGTQVPGLITSLGDPAELTRRMSTAPDQNVLSDAAWLREQADRNMRESTGALEPEIRRGGLAGFFAQTAQDAAQSGISSAASLVGGPYAGAVAGGVSYANAYAEAKRAGATDEDAEAYAGTMGGIEGAISTIPAGKLLERVPVVGRYLKTAAREGGEQLAQKLTNPALAAAIRSAKTMGGEATEEATTGALQDITGAWVAGQLESDEARTTLTEQHTEGGIEGFIERRKREAAAGAFMAGAKAPIDYVQARQDYNSQLQEREDRITRQILDRSTAPTTTPTTRAPTSESVAVEDDPQGDLFGGRGTQLAEEQNVPRQQPGDDPLDDPEVSRARREVLRKRRDEEVERLTTLEQRVEEDEMLRGTAAWGAEQDENARDLEQTRRRVDLLNQEIGKWEGGAADQLGLQLNTPKQPRPAKVKPVQTRGGDKVYHPDGRVTSNVDDRNRKEARNLLDEQSRNDNKLIDTEFKRRKEQHATARKDHLKQIAEQNRGLPPTERIEALASAARAWDASNPLPTREAITLEDAQAAAAKPTKGKAATPKPVTTVPTTSTTQSAKPVSKEEEKIKGLADKLGLAMEEDGSTQRSSPDRAKFEKDVRTIVRSLSRSNTQKDIDILNLAEQGKLEFAPTPEAVGQDTVGPNVRALYRPSEGKMYIYTDRVDPKDTMAVVIRGYHEGTHGGQFNEREGRSAVLRTLLGESKYGNAVEIIKRAAANGNKVAKAAVDKAQRNAPEDMDLEIPAYFVGEVVANRGRPLGSVAGVARDIMSGAKSAVKTVLGGDPNISFNDIYSAVNSLGQEIVATDLRPTQSPDREMVMNQQATGFDRAVAEARDFTDEMGQIKFLISDANSRIIEDGVTEIRNLRDGETVPLGEVLDHPELYANYPEAANIPVGPAPGMQYSGVYLPIIREIQLSPKILNGKSSIDLRGVLLHEVQHWIQDEGGESRLFHGGHLDARNLNERQLEIVDNYNTALANNNAQVQRVLDNVSVFRRELSSRTQQAGIDRILSREQAQVKKAAALVQAAEDAGGLSPHLRRIVDDFVKSLEDYRKAADKYNEVSRAAFDKYTANPTEAEAFFTQAYRDVPDDRLPRNPRSDPQYGTTAMQARAFGRDLAMAEEATAVTNRWAPAWLRGLVDPTKGVGRVANEIIEHAMDSPAGDRMRAEAAMGRFDNAIEELAAERGVTAKELNDQIARELDAIPKDIDGYDANRAAFNDVAKKYGKAGEILGELRDQVDELTLTMVQQRADSGVPLSDQEKKLYTTLMNNLGRYSHRQYAAHAGELGNSYSKAVWKDYDKYRKNKGKARENPVIKENFRKVASAVKYLVENNLAIPADKELASLGADQTRNLYTTWIGNPKGVSLDDMKTSLADARDAINGNTDALIKEAEQVVKELIDLAPTNSPLVSYYRGAKQDTSILQKRTDIPKELRDVMGEITDPSMRMLLTVAKQAEFVAKNKMFLELIQNPQGDILPPGSRIPDGWTRLKGEGYGPMENYIVSPNMLAAVGDVQQVLATFEQAVAMSARNPKELGQMVLTKTADGWSWLAGKSKVMQIVWSPMNFAYNLVGGPSIMLMHGNLNPKYLGRGFSDAVGLVAYAVNPKSANADITSLVENGVVDSAYIGELKNEQYRALHLLVKEMSGRGRSPSMQKAMNFLHLAGASVKETYAMMDVMYKIANFHQQVDLLKDFYKANGETRTDEQIRREAADNTKRTNFTYRRAMPIVKAIEQRGFSAFGPYMNEVFRTQITNVLQGLSEIQRAKNANTPEARNIMLRQGVGRVAGQLATIGMWSYISSLLGGMTFGDDEEEAKAKRALLPDYLRDQDFAEVGKDSNGMPVLFNISRFDPVGPVTDFIRSAMHDQNSIEVLTDKIVDVYIAPRIASQLAIAATASVPDSKKFPSRVPLTQQLAPEQYATMLEVGKEVGIPSRVTKAWTNVAEALLPGVTMSWRDTNARPVRDSVASSTFNTLSYAGANLASLDPKKPVQFAALDLKSASELGRKELAEYFKDNPNGNLENTVSQILRSRAREREAFNDTAAVYKGARAMDMSPMQINALLKKQRLTGDQVRAVATGRFTSTLISQESFNRYRDFELADAPKSEHPAIKKKWREAWSMLRTADKASTKEE